MVGFLLAVALLAAFVLGDVTGRARAQCVVIREYRAALMAEPDYWSGPIRTLVEACDRGEGAA